MPTTPSFPPPLPSPPDRHRQPLTASQLVAILAVLAGIVVAAMLYSDANAAGGNGGALVGIVVGGCLLACAIPVAIGRWTATRSNKRRR